MDPEETWVSLFLKKKLPAGVRDGRLPEPHVHGPKTRSMGLEMLEGRAPFAVQMTGSRFIPDAVHNHVSSAHRESTEMRERGVPCREGGS